jgi:predicted GTPase
MSEIITIHDPTAPCGGRTEHERRRLADLKGKTVGFIDNGKPNFHYLVDDLAERLIAKYGVAGVRKHRKRGSVPVMESVLKDYAENCDAVITGSGD